MDEGTLTLGQLARQAGVGRETVRYYERRGLLADPGRTPGGYRRYPPESVDRLRFIRRAQGLGFTLDEISELLELRVDEVASCAAVEARARRKLERVGEKIAELEGIRRVLEGLVEACAAREPTGECPILEAMEAPEDGA